MNWYYIIVNYSIVFILGGIVAFSELLSIYSEPKQILRIREGRWYIYFNGFVSVFALLVLRKFNITLLSYANIDGGQILIAGTSAMVILRSSIASVKVGKKDVDAKIVPIIQIFKDSVNKGYDRKRSQLDLNEIKEIMKDVNFEKAQKELPLICLNLLKTLSLSEGGAMSKEVSELAKTTSDPRMKSINLGIILERYTGVDLLKNAVNTAKEVMGESPGDQLTSFLKKFE